MTALHQCCCADVHRVCVQEVASLLRRRKLADPHVANVRCCCRRVVIAIGLCLHFLGHFGLWLAATGRIQLSYLQVFRDVVCAELS